MKICQKRTFKQDIVSKRIFIIRLRCSPYYLFFLLVVDFLQTLFLLKNLLIFSLMPSVISTVKLARSNISFKSVGPIKP